MLAISLICLFSFIPLFGDGVKVSINSGNPRFPFPQFLPYVSANTYFGNLATTNGVGVPHAEMEKTIREAWQILANRFEYTGQQLNGVKYIKANNGCPYDCTEGDGYALMGAAYMADKTTFDGIWLRTHDVRRVKQARYLDGAVFKPDYNYGDNTLIDGTDAAADGDFDVALALLAAWMQWGDFMGINDSRGNPISYKKEALDVIKGLVEIKNSGLGDSRSVSGDIGFDGYFKNGNTWGELTNWASSNQIYNATPEYGGPTSVHVDYGAPAFFREFADILKKVDPAANKQNISQFERAEASSDWLMGELFKQSAQNIPFAGWVEHKGGTNFTFSKFNEGEDFRHPWRHLMNPVWHGNPNTTWNPVTHQVAPGANTFEMDMGLRFAKFLYNAQSSPWNNPCVDGYWGPSVLYTNWEINGTGGRFFFLNWIHGAGSPAAVIAQDYELMGEMYRQNEIEWDVTGAVGPDVRYLDSKPFYYHGWFRLLGMLILTGNYHAPSAMVPKANMKVYLDVDKTFAFESDLITYTVHYRNYGSVDAQGVVITDTLPADFNYVSSTGGGVYSKAGNVVSWTIGTVKGFTSLGGTAPTQGSVKLVVKIDDAKKTRYANKAGISCVNGSGWTSNEYPNNVTSVMERNLVDIARRALIIQHDASKAVAMPGETVTFTTKFENTSEAGWINGGRPGVHFSYGHAGTPANSNTHKIQFRLFHDADEAYVDYGNYRVSYFLYDEERSCLTSEPGCAKGWILTQNVPTEGMDRETFKLIQEDIVPGADARGKWNQRIIIQFSDPGDPNRKVSLATINHHLAVYYGVNSRIHRGGTAPLRIVWDLVEGSWQDVQWNDDWSWDAKAASPIDGMYFPVTNDWTDIYRPDVPVATWHPKNCDNAPHTVDNVLVEEWDGYTWRRVAGNGPMPGRDVENVVIRDTIPQGLTFVAFTGANPLGVAPQINGNVITWRVPRMQIQQKGEITYTVKAANTCPATGYILANSRAWIEADKESPVSDGALVTVKCSQLPVTAPPTADPPGGIFTAAVNVSLASATPDAAIYYTLDGSDPVPGDVKSKVFAAGVPITITDTTVLKAIAVRDGHLPSVIITETYIKKVQTAQQPVANPPGGVFSGSLSITLSTATPGARIYYTLDGSNPVPGDVKSRVFTAGIPITVTDTTVLKAIAVREGYLSSAVITEIYTKRPIVKQPVASPPGKEFSGSLSVTLSTATPGASIYYTLNGSTPAPSSPGTILYTPGVAVVFEKSGTLAAVAVKEGFDKSPVMVEEYTYLPPRLNPPEITPFATPHFDFFTSLKYPGSLEVEIKSVEAGATVYFTLDGSEPKPAPGGSTQQYTEKITITKSLTVKAIAVKDGWRPSLPAVSVYRMVERMDPIHIDRVWIIDGNGDGRGDSVFISLRESYPVIPAPVSSIDWPLEGGDEKRGIFSEGDPNATNMYRVHDSLFVIDFSEDPFSFGTEASETAPPTLVMPDSNRAPIQDGMGPVIAKAWIEPPDFKEYILEGDPGRVIREKPDTLVVEVTEPVLPSMQSGSPPWLDLFLYSTNCTSGPSKELTMKGPPLVSEDGLRLKVPVLQSEDGSAIRGGDCLSFNPANRYADQAGNKPGGKEVIVAGENDIFQDFKTSLYQSIIGGGYDEINQPEDLSIPVIDAQGNVVEYYIQEADLGWIPPRHITPYGEIDRAAQEACTSVPQPVLRDVPENCLSLVRVVSRGAYTAEVNIFDNLGKFIHRSTQKFGYCGELENPDRKQPGGYVSFLIWNQKDIADRFVGSGVYIWNVIFRHGSDLSRAERYRQGIARSEQPGETCSVE